ncbi:MAG: ATP-binding cassette domain-containing protein, partial [Verrucomicrobiales bacterium]|nr:ATP-binding cassette domain-containing protein [Verrucomicrobiales bacterium]
LDYQDLIFYLNARKNVSSTRLYLAFSSTGTPYIEKTQTRDSFLEIIFGLDIVVRALRDTDTQINDQPLPRSAEIEVSLNDRITFGDKSQVSMAELRRRARELGGSFNLTTSRTEYLVSNDPIKLREGDILLSSGTTGKLLLKIRCDYAERTGELEVIEADRPIFVRGVQVRDHAPLSDGETITIGEGQYLRCDFADRTIEEERNIISRLEIRDLSHRYTTRSTALESISLSARRGELICVMGPSGCGKSTLLRALAGHLKPKEGQVLLNGFSLFEHTESLTPFISYIPHEEAYDPLLTVEENISTASAIRSPHLSLSDRATRVENKLTELGLYQLRNRLAGEPEDKFLSGGERKRLNVGLDMIAISDVFLIDEPTSGLSSKDSEHVIEIIRGLAHNKIIFVSIHQPSARLFGMFHKALLLDKGGKMAFFGTPDEMLDYFHDAHVEEVGRPPESSSTIGAPDTNGPDQSEQSWRQPDLIFDVLETPLRDLGGDVIYEEDSRGHTTPARRFSPSFWGDRFQAHRIVQDATKATNPASSGDPTESPAVNSANAIPSQQKLPNPPVRRGRENAIQFVALLYRALRSKLRNRANLVTTLLEAPLLATLVATVLRYSEDGTYTFAAAFHIPAYLFLTLVVGMFLGLTNSADEIIRDRALLQRERNQNVRILHYIASKFIALSVFALLQCIVYLLIANAILEVRGMFWNHLGWMLLTQLNGVAIGLLISSFVRDSKTALNWIPVVLIPQIILGGALIKYEEMNRNLDFVFSIRHWLEQDSDTGTAEPPSRLKVPTICQFMPLRWSYESIVISQANQNPVAGALAAINSTVDELKVKPELDKSERQLFDRAKQALALIAGLEADEPQQLRRMLRRIHQQLDNRSINLKKFPLPETDTPVSADEVYINQKIRDLVDKAEMERTDYRDAREQNVFFGTQRTFEKPEFLITAVDGAPPESSPTTPDDVFVVRTLDLNRAVLILFIAVSLTALFLTLRRKLTRFA